MSQHSEKLGLLRRDAATTDCRLPRSGPLRRTCGTRNRAIERGHSGVARPHGAGAAGRSTFACRYGGRRLCRYRVPLPPPADIIDVGGYCLRLSQVDALVSRADPDATIVALPDGDLGHRLAGTAPDRKALQGLLKTEGVNPLIVGAFDQQGTHEAA